MAYIPVALEMYSVRKEFTENPLATMKAVKEMGFEGVEFAGNPQFSPQFYASLLQECGLVCCGWHTPLTKLEPDSIEETVKLNLAVGNKYLIVPWLDADSHDGWKMQAQKMNAVSDALAPYGMRTGYHCHQHDFTDMDGRRPWDTFMAEVSGRVVMQFDTGNAMAGGADVMAELRRFPGRGRTLHLKPYSFKREFEALIGEDDCPWKDIFSFCQKECATEWYIIEYECPAYPALEAVKRCLDAVRAML